MSSSFFFIITLPFPSLLASPPSHFFHCHPSFQLQNNESDISASFCNNRGNKKTTRNNKKSTSWELRTSYLKKILKATELNRSNSEEPTTMKQTQSVNNNNKWVYCWVYSPFTPNCHSQESADSLFFVLSCLLVSSLWCCVCCVPHVCELLVFVVVILNLPLSPQWNNSHINNSFKA